MGGGGWTVFRFEGEVIRGKCAGGSFVCTNGDSVGVIE